MYLISKINDDTMVIVGLYRNAEVLKEAALHHHPCKVWRLHQESADLLPAWDAERFEKMRRSAGATGEEQHEP